MQTRLVKQAADIIRRAGTVIGFTGAGISVESGMDPFRGPGGMWERHDPAKFEKRYFVAHPNESWTLIKELFYDPLEDICPNAAHESMAWMEKQGLLHGVITQNIDGLHQKSGSRTVWEYHGSTRMLDCMDCRKKYHLESVSLKTLPPPCPGCGGLLKPDIVFFGEPIPEDALRGAKEAAMQCRAMLVVGTSGEVQPAARLPHMASNNGATIIEINVRPSAYTDTITDVFIQSGAVNGLAALRQELERG